MVKYFSRLDKTKRGKTIIGQHELQRSGQVVKRPEGWGGNGEEMRYCDQKVGLCHRKF